MTVRRGVEDIECLRITEKSLTNKRTTCSKTIVSQLFLQQPKQKDPIFLDNAPPHQREILQLQAREGANTITTIQLCVVVEENYFIFHINSAYQASLAGALNSSLKE